MNKLKYVGDCCNDLGKSVECRMLVVQDTIWPGVSEVRIYAPDNKIYGAMYDGEDQMVSYAEIPERKEVLK